MADFLLDLGYGSKRLFVRLDMVHVPTKFCSSISNLKGGGFTFEIFWVGALKAFYHTQAQL